MLAELKALDAGANSEQAAKVIEEALKGADPDA
jgi:hypothetical protein